MRRAYRRVNLLRRRSNGLFPKVGVKEAKLPCLRVYGELPVCATIPRFCRSCYYAAMRDLLILFFHVIATLARLMGRGGVCPLVAESLLVKRQLLILNRSRQRAPKLRTSDRFVAGLCALFM